MHAILRRPCVPDDMWADLGAQAQRRRRLSEAPLVLRQADLEQAAFRRTLHEPGQVVPHPASVANADLHARICQASLGLLAQAAVAQDNDPLQSVLFPAAGCGFITLAASRSMASDGRW